MTYVNAGHNPPVLVARNSAPAFIRPRSGMMLGAMGGLPYTAHKLALAPGDMLYLYTDGITEQPDMRGELFGEERLRFSIETMLASGGVALERGDSPLLRALFRAVSVHGGGAELADDCTQLLLRYNGDGGAGGAGGRRFARSFPAVQKGVADASAFIDEIIETADSPKIHVILDEIASNIVKHSGATGFDLAVELLDSPAGVRLVFTDDGKPYDPLAHTDPDTTLPAEERPIGGLGIMMVKKMASSISYRCVGGRNILTIDLVNKK